MPLSVTIFKSENFRGLFFWIWEVKCKKNPTTEIHSEVNRKPLKILEELTSHLEIFIFLVLSYRNF